MINAAAILLLIVGLSSAVTHNMLSKPKSLINLIISRGANQGFGSIHQTVHNGNPTSLLNSVGEEEALLLSELAEEFLEEYRHHMSTGNRYTPALDPLHFRRIPQVVKKYMKAFRFTIKIWDIYVRGISTFILNNLQIRLKARTVDFNFTIPIVLIEARYRLRASTTMNLFAYEPEGLLSIYCTGVTIQGNLAVDVEFPPEGGDRFIIPGYHVTLNVKSIEMSMSGLASGRRANNFLNAAIINAFSDITLDAVVNRSADLFVKAVVIRINNSLSLFSATEIIQLVSLTNSNIRV